MRNSSWRLGNVLKLHTDIVSRNILGVGTKIISILDGNTEQESKGKQYNNVKKLFMPISNIEQFLFDIIYNKKNKQLRKEINDRYFQLNSLDMICANFNKDSKGNQKPKIFYRYLIKDLQSRNVLEKEFIESLSDDILSGINYSKFLESFKRVLQ